MQYFYPEQFRINNICAEWVKRGYDVTVLTGIPNYPQGRFYDGYGLFDRRRENWNGIKIIRIPLIPRGHNSIGLVMNYLSFPISGFFWNIFTDVKADYVFMFETSPMNQCKIGVRYAKKHKVPLYLYVQDLWPENVEIVTGIHNPLVIHPIDRMVDKIYRACNEIFVTSPSFVESVVNRKIPVPRQKVHYWSQYAEEFYKPVSRKDATERLMNNKPDMAGKLIEDDDFKIAFTGNIGYAQGLDILTKTAVLLQNEKVKFVIEDLEFLTKGRLNRKSTIVYYGLFVLFAFSLFISGIIREPFAFNEYSSLIFMPLMIISVWECIIGLIKVTN